MNDINNRRELAAFEAVLFAAGEPLSADKIAEAMNCTPERVFALCDELCGEYEARGAGITVLRLENRLQLCTKKEYHEYVRAVLELRRNTPLSQAAFEVLAVIAYNQPVTKSFVEQVRGVDCSGVVSSLCEKGLIEEKGRLDLPGRPLLYGTTDAFLRCFSMSSLADLPPVPHDDQNEDTADETAETNSETAESDNIPAESGDVPADMTAADPSNEENQPGQINF